ncbi:hypothetical protein N658DRAFT_483201 [Parathielavia hyrcaniae]|uniref:Aminoglycoside phosphotransferase domain-containing protein n=1 Tax=Parathielavia hyrcaniae TaxID=113614 RepID=A0AAN6Q8Z4_9PEZI|nr:hypothetical protein N658DRAFT_483201 [Parathielavia hyrcaniae]
MAHHKRVETVLSQLPDISLHEFDFLDSSFFRSLDHGTHSGKLPSPQAVLEASGARRGVWRFQELGVLVKYGHYSHLHLEEALALRFVNKMLLADEVPAPEVFGWKTAGERNFIYMELMPGERLRDAWETFSQADKESVSHQLEKIVKNLRSVEQDTADQFIGSLNRGPVQDVYLSPDFHKGPFASAREFHDYVQFVALYWMPLEERPPEPYRAMLPDTARICLTHADLHLSNILVVRSANESRVTVSANVDWEQAGWYPEYWEYCKAMIVGSYGDEWRDDGWVNMPLKPYEKAYEAFEEYWTWKCP